MHIRVLVHGLLTAAVEDPDRWLDVALPTDANVEELVQALCQWLDSPLFDPRSCIATLEDTVVPMNHPLQEGDEVQFKLVGDLTIREITQPATFDVTAKLEGDTITGVATAQLLMTDFGIDPPNFANTLTVQNEFAVQVEFTAREQ